jgi:hypothetical protein
MQVREALVAHARQIYAAFDFYASLGSSSNVTAIGFNAYKVFITDAGFAIDGSKHCDHSHIDQLFVAINAAGAIEAAAARRAGRRVDAGGGSTSFSRSEWVHMLLRVGLARYILDGDETDVSRAIGLTMFALVWPLIGLGVPSDDASNWRASGRRDRREPRHRARVAEH